MTVGTVCVSGGVMRSCMNYGGRRQIGQSGMKKVYYEWLRCIACFMVIFNHLKGYRLFMDASGIKQICYIILSVLTKINVPVFFMVSGALLLEKQEDFRIVFKKRISRIGLVILLFEAGIYTECMLYARAQGTPLCVYDETLFLWNACRESGRDRGVLVSLCVSGLSFYASFFAKNCETDEQTGFLYIVCAAFCAHVSAAHTESLFTDNGRGRNCACEMVFCFACFLFALFLSSGRILP